MCRSAPGVTSPSSAASSNTSSITSKYFPEYVVNYTNAATIVSEDFVDTEQLDGLFSGYNPKTGAYDNTSWSYEGMDEAPAAGRRMYRTGREKTEPGGHELGGRGASLAHSVVRRDETLQDPFCVFQILKRHYARYTPEMVEQICGVSPAQFARVCEAVTTNSGRERTTAWVYSVGWTQHSVGVQYIRGAAIIQLLLGNIGRPGGGILALRGHASIQGSTDIPTLFDLLPGYLPMPRAGVHGNLGEYLASIKSDGQKGFWTAADAYTVSLLKAWFGDAATKDNDFGFNWLPRISGDHGTYQTTLDMLDDKVEGYFLLGQNPAVGSANGKLQRQAMSHLKWLVVRDFSLIESATFWKDGPEIATGEMRSEDIGTEVFFLPAAAHTEKSGTFTQTQRMLQWHHKAVEPPGDCRSDLQFFHELGKRLREQLAASTLERDAPLRHLTWDYPEIEGGEPDAGGGAPRGERPAPHRGKARPDAQHLRRHEGGWINVRWMLDLHRRVHRRRQSVGATQARFGAVVGRPGMGLGVADEPPHPLQPRVGGSGRQAVERAQGVRVVGRDRPGSGPATTSPTSR